MCPEVIAIGEILVDMVPTRSGSYKEVTAFKRCFGGAPFNFAIGVARLGGNVGAVCSVGNDQFGKFLVDTLKRNNVDISHVIIKNARTTLAFVLRGPAGERDFFFYRKPWTETADTLLSPEDIDPEYISKAKLLHFSGVALSHNPERIAVFRAIEIAKKAGVKVSFDLNIRSDLWRSTNTLKKVYNRAIYLSDFVLLARNESEYLFGTSDPEKVVNIIMRKYKPRCVAVKMGASGCFVKLNGEPGIHVKAFKVPVVDTTGAGDGWAAGFLLALLQGKELKKCAVLANAVGALVTTKLGAITALPTYEELKDFLKKNGYEFS